jgi:hypothetical protein
MMRAEVPLNSPIATALGSSGQPLTLRLEDGAPLIIPPSPMVLDYLRRCTGVRPGEAGAMASPPAGNSTGAAAPQGTSPEPVAGTNSAAPTAGANSVQPKQ